MAYREISNPFKYRAHYNTKIRAVYEPLSCNIHIEQPIGGTIIAIYNGVNYTKDFSVPKGQSIIIKTQIQDAYILNHLFINDNNINTDTKYVVNEDINITMDLAIRSFLVKLKANEFYNLTISSDYDTSIGPAVKNQITETSFYANYGEEITISVAPIESHKLNNILLYENNSKTPIKYTNNTMTYTVKKNISIEADCEIKKFLVSISQPLETHNDYKTTGIYYNDSIEYDSRYVLWGETIRIGAESTAMTD